MRRNFAEFSSETKVRNFLAEIREFHRISAKFGPISFAQQARSQVFYGEVRAKEEEDQTRPVETTLQEISRRKLDRMDLTLVRCSRSTS